MMPYERLEAWTAVRHLAVAVYRATEQWPSSERFGMTSQIRRAAISACANLAEGSARKGCREFGRFLDIALGSLAEASALMTVAADLGYLPREDLDALRTTQQKAGRLVWGLHQAIRRKA